MTRVRLALAIGFNFILSLREVYRAREQIASPGLLRRSAKWGAPSSRYLREKRP